MPNEQMWDAAHVRHMTTNTRPEVKQINNGQYTVRTPGGITFRYRIFTIQHTQTPALLNKRCIAVWEPSTRRWDSFGFIFYTGYLRWWSRFENQRHNEYGIVADWLVEKLRDISQIPGETWEELTEIGHNIRNKIHCFVCNAYCVGEDERSVGLCFSHNRDVYGREAIRRVRGIGGTVTHVSIDSAPLHPELIRRVDQELRSRRNEIRQVYAEDEQRPAARKPIPKSEVNKRWVK